MGKNYFLKTILVVSCWLSVNAVKAQVAYGSTGSYGLRLIVPTYTGSAIQVRRTCDNATLDIGFSCGGLNTNTLDRFVLASNPLSTISAASAASFSLRKLSCVYAGKAVSVRRSCDNAVQDIGFTAAGDFDTTGLQQFVFKASPLSVLSAAAAAAYSVRKLYCNYVAAGMQVRRSSDNELRDVYFDGNGVISLNSPVSAAGGGAATATLLGVWLGANSGYVNIWYDQSGNNNTATAPASGNQPKIVNAGVITTQNGLPALVFDGATSYLTIPYTASMNFVNASSCNAVLARTGNASGSCDAVFTQQYTSGNISATLAWNSVPAPGTTLSYGYYPPSWQNAYLPTDVTINTDNIITGTILSGAANTTAINLYENGTLQAALTNQITVGAQSSLGFNIGKRWDLPNYAPINLQELIVFSSVLSTTDRQYLEFSQSAYYGISGPPSLAAIPVAAPSAYVATWYDQSGNGRDAKAAVANQPRIMNAGVIDRQNKMPAIYFGGLTYGLSTTSFSTYTAAACFNGVARVNANLTYNTIVNKTGSGVANYNYPGPLDFYNNNVLVGNGIAGQYNTYGATATFNAATTTSMGIWTYQANGTSASGVNAYYNSTQIVTNQTASFCGDNSTPLYIGSRADNQTGLNGWIAEVLTFNVVPSTTDRAYIEYTQGLYYNVAGPSLGTVPASPASAYVTKWYDQSGNGNDIVQATAANQPRIVNSGTVITQGGLPVIPLDGTNYYMGQSTISISNPYTANAVATRTGAAGGSSSGYQRLLNISATGDAYGFMGAFTSGGLTTYANFTGNGSSWNDMAADAPATSVLLNTQSILSMVVATGATGLVPSINGTGLGGKTGTTATATGFLIGGVYSTSSTNQMWTGNISEFNIFATGISSTRRNLLETNQAAFYGVASGSSKYTAASGYNLFVTGIGRYIATDSIADSRTSAGMGIITGTTSTDYLKDNGDYITFGMSCPQATVSLANLPAGATAGYERWANDWYINKTDVNANGGNLQLFFDFSDYGVTGVPVTASNYQLWGRASTASSFTVVPTSTVTIVGDRVVFTLNATSLGTTGYYTIGTVDFQNSPLPIELLSFDAVPDGDKVDVKWETITETNNAYFTVEKSKDGVNFTKVVDMPGAGNSTSYKNYADVDYEPYSGTSYYRLKQTDNNGAYKYFTMVPVNFTVRKNIVLYPNPISNTTNLNVKLNGFQNQEVVVVLRDVQGREFISKVFLTIEGSEIFIVEEAKNLAPGTYIVTASTNDKIYNYKLIVK